MKWPLCSVQRHHRGAQPKYQVQTGSRGTANFKVQAEPHPTQGATEREICPVGVGLCRLSEASGENVTQGHGLGLGNGRFKVSQLLLDLIVKLNLPRVTLQDQFAAFHDLELAFKLEEAELLEKELAEMEEKNQKKSLFQTLEHTDGSIEACQACKKYEESAKFRAKFKKVKDQQMRKSGRGKVK